MDSDYSITYVAGSLTVTTAPLTITANNQTKAYGAALPTLTASYTGFVNGDTSSQPDDPAHAHDDGHRQQPCIGTYTITASGAVDSDYTITYVGGTLTVTAAALTITAEQPDQGLRRGVADADRVSYSGFVNGDTAANLTTQPTLATTATASSHVAGNPYTITASGAVDPDYSITYVTGTLTVTAASLTITANNQTKVYGAALPTLTASYTGFVNGDTSASLTTQPTLTTTATASSQCRAAPTRITASGAVDPDYSITYVAGSLTVTPVALTITANNQTKVYGAAVPTLTAIYCGLRQWRHLGQLDHPAHAHHDGHRQQPCRGQPVLHHGLREPSTATTRSAMSTGTLTVTPAALTITADEPDQGLWRGLADAHRSRTRASSMATPRPA